MKKYFVLTSVLALTACFGGGSSSEQGVVVEPATKPAITSVDNITIDERTATNAKINYISSKIPNVYEGEITIEGKLRKANELLTNMHNVLEQYINLQDDYTALCNFIAENEDSVNEALLLFRGECSGNCSALIYPISQTNLDNFEKLHGMVAGEMTPNDMFFDNYKLFFENGKLIAIEDMYGQQFDLAEGTSKTFDLTQLPDYDPETWPMTVTETVKSALIGHTVGLKYSDFGYFLYEKTGTYADGSIEKQTDISGLRGGYIPKEKEIPHKNMVFTGKAVAPLWAHTYDHKTEKDDFYTMVSVTSDAKLSLYEGTETLQANFNNAENPWYNVTITKNGNNDAHVGLSGDENKIPELYKIKGEAYGNPMNTTYYGDNTVSEVTANTMVYGSGVLSETDSYTHEVDADIVFGGVKQ